MKKYEDSAAPTTGTFPDTESVNSSPASAKNGTPWIKEFVDDSWGFAQALMDAAGLTPDGSVEEAGASQRLEAVRRIAGHPGEVALWAGYVQFTDPSLLGIRLLPLNGQGIARLDYPELDNVVYCGDANNPTASAYYHATDAAGTIRNTAGAYLILPDYRGVFMRGYDPTAIHDPGGASRDPGDIQSEEYKQHAHAPLQNDPTTPTLYQDAEAHYVYLTAGAGRVLRGVTIQSATYPTNVQWAPVTAGSPDETRPVNAANQWCIRY